MRAKLLHVVPQPFNPMIAAVSLHPAWWKPWERRRCAGAHCPYRGKLFPEWLRTSARVCFEGRWYCEPRCFKSTLEFRVSNLLSVVRARRNKVHRLPIGLLLASRGLISSEQLRNALRLQRETKTGRLGEWFCRFGLVREEQIAAALAQQWGCVVFPLDTKVANPIWGACIPLTLLDSARAVVAHASIDGRTLHLAFGECLDHFLLYAVEQMLDCRTVACVASESRIAESLAQTRLHSERVGVCFDTIRDPIEMSAIICNYAVELQATRVSVARVSAHIWVRFFSGTIVRDLLFRVLPDTPYALHLERFVETPKGLLSEADSTKDGVTDASGPI